MYELKIYEYHYGHVKSEYYNNYEEAYLRQRELDNYTNLSAEIKEL